MKLLGQKRADILKFARFVQNSVRNYELLKISVSCQKRKEKNNVTKFSQYLTCSLREKERATVSLPIWVCLVNNIQGTSICCFR